MVLIALVTVEVVVIVQQVDLADLLEVHAHRVAGEHDRGGIDAAGAGTAARGADGAGLLLGFGRRHLGIGLTGHLEVMVLIALVTVEVVVIVRHVAVIVIHDQLGVVILGGRDDLDAAVAKELVNGGQLCISDVDVTPSRHRPDGPS